MLDDIYNRRILELAADIPRLGRLDGPDGSATAHSRLCGSTVNRSRISGQASSLNAITEMFDVSPLSPALLWPKS